MIFGETLNWTPNNIIEGKGPETPTSWKRWGVQVGAGIISNRFGKATDNYLSEGGFGEAMVREYFKGLITTGANSVPQEVE